MCEKTRYSKCGYYCRCNKYSSVKSKSAMSLIGNAPMLNNFHSSSNHCHLNICCPLICLRIFWDGWKCSNECPPAMLHQACRSCRLLDCQPYSLVWHQRSQRTRATFSPFSPLNSQRRQLAGWLTSSLSLGTNATMTFGLPSWMLTSSPLN